jgi:hypothetical protein
MMTTTKEMDMERKEAIDKIAANTEETTMTIYFTKQFTSGILKGLAVNTSVSFATLEAASQFASGYSDRTKSHRDIITKDRFLVTDLSFQKYDRS